MARRPHARVPRLQPEWSSPLETCPDTRSGLWKVSCNTHCVRSYACGYAVQPALQIALRLFGQDGKHRSALARGGVLLDSAEGPMREFPGFSRSGTHRSVLHANHLRFFGRTGDATGLQSVPFCPRLCLARQNGQQTGFSLLECKRWWLTAGDLSPKLGDLRMFPGFSWFGKCDSRERSESERRRSVIPIREADRGRSHATFADAHSYGFAYAVRFSRRIADGSPGRMAMFPGFSRSGKCDSMAVYCSIRRAGFRQEWSFRHVFARNLLLLISYLLRWHSHAPDGRFSDIFF